MLKNNLAQNEIFGPAGIDEKKYGIVQAKYLRLENKQYW